jgi:hypothetical protein
MGGFGIRFPGSGPGGFANQVLQPTNVDPLTNAINSATNMGQTAAPQFWYGGSGMLGAGMDTVSRGLQTMDPAAEYWQKILSGDTAAMTAATAPTATMLSNIYGGAQNNVSTGAPAGGYRSVSMASLPQQQAAQVGQTLLSLQPTAAQNLASIGGAQGQLGLGVSQQGIAEQAQGTQLLNLILQSMLGVRGQDVSKDIANQQALTQGLLSLVSGGAQVGAAQVSDLRIKEGIVPLGTYKGIPIYAFRFAGDPEVRMGVMAQEAYELYPDAVEVGGEDPAEHPWRVDYTRLFEHLDRVA